MTKFIIVGLVVCVIISLFSGLFFLIKDEDSKTRVVNALFIRVALSALLVGFIVYMMLTGHLALNPMP